MAATAGCVNSGTAARPNGSACSSSRRGSSRSFRVPFASVAANPVTRPLWLSIAAAIWILSVLGETAADRQLARFRADPANRGRTCRTGLWRYSRHPNYFFEWLHWFTYVALAVGSPLAWYSLSGPVIMLVFLRWVSGIPYTEAQALRTRGDDYRDYQARTSTLFPWPPRRSRPGAIAKEPAMNIGLPIAPALELPQDRPAPGVLGLAERGLLPDALLRWGVRRWCAQRLREELAGGLAAQGERFHARLAQLRAADVALHTDAANAQHYELPPRVLRALPRAATEIFLRLLPPRQGDPRSGRRGHARPLRRACRARRRTGDTGAWLRLGIAYALDGRTLSAGAHQRGLQFPAAARVHRAPVRISGLTNVSVTTATSIAWRCRRGASTAASRSRCSSTCEIKRGYRGSPDHFRHFVALHRPRPPTEAYLRLRTLQGEQGQVDWAQHFGRLQMGRALRPLMGFVMVLSYSRRTSGCASFWTRAWRISCVGTSVP